jgi:SAM-dependent methyltransferase
MANVLKRGCPVCDGTEGDVIHRQKFVVPVELAAPDAVDIVVCDGCGMCFSDLAVPQVEIDAAYAEHSKYADTSLYAADGEVDLPPTDAPWDLERLEGTAQWLAAKVPPGARVLDAGCATGALISFLQTEGFDQIVGLDPSPVAVVTVRRRYGVDAIAGSLFDPPLDLGRFDLVILSHVMEHLRDIRAAVEGLHRMTNLGGLVYVEVPDATGYADRLVAPFHDFNTEHINHFSELLLQSLFQAAGFVTRESGTKVVLSSPTDPYPATFGLFEKVSEDLRWGTVAPDPDLAPAIEEYVEKSSALMDEYTRVINAEVGTGPIVVWGAGQLSMKLLAGSLARVEVEAIVDGSEDRWGMQMGGMEVVSPESIRSSSSPILVTSVHHFASIAADIEKRYPGRRTVVLPTDLTATT